MAEHMAKLREILLLPPQEVWSPLVELFNDWPADNERDIGINYAITHMKEIPLSITDFTNVDEAHPCWQIASHFLALDDPLVCQLIALTRRYNQSGGHQLDKLIQIDAMGEKELHWFLDGRSGRLLLLESSPEDPDCQIWVDYQSFLDMFSGKQSAQMLFMMGKLKVAGDMSVMLRFATWLHSPS